LTLRFSRFEGLVYRGHHPGWAWDPLSGEGAKLHGGRFNRIGRPCFYSALSLKTAWLEAQQGFAFKAQPLTICAYRVDCDHVLDLTDEAVRDEAGIKLDTLACPWERLNALRQPVPSWNLVDQLLELGCAAIRVPSFAARAQPEDRNMVFWSWSEEPPHRVVVVDDAGRLPRNQDSWKETN
jgi:RES domain-containing protein